MRKLHAGLLEMGTGICSLLCYSTEAGRVLAQEAPAIHISYHDGEHYNSVRMAGDAGSGPPHPIVLRERAASAEDWTAVGDAEVELVMQNTGCYDNRDAVQRALQDAKGNSDEVRGKMLKPYLSAMASLDLTELDLNEQGRHLRLTYSLLASENSASMECSIK